MKKKNSKLALFDLGLKLTKEQEKAKPGVMFIQSSAVRTGKSFLLATCILEKLVDGCGEVEVWDHYPRYNSARFVLMNVEKMLEDLKHKGWKIRYEAFPGRNSIRVISAVR